MTARPRAAVTAAAVLLCSALLLAGCTNTPPPPLVSKPPQPSSPVPREDLKQVVLGIDRLGHGFNPHKIADTSRLTTALASAMLPSVFRPAADGTPELDRSVMQSARVTSSEPFTVTYAVRGDASWSDGVPVRAEDFLYLRDQMATQPGVVNPAGYRLISDITASEGGRVVQVRFAQPYPGWRSLFAHLLPGHILKDAPGGWNGAMQEGYPGSAGPYVLDSLDRARGEVTLERNPRYWATPSVAKNVVLRRSDIHGVASGLRSGANQLATVSSDTASARALDALGDRVRTTAEPRDAVAQLQLRPVGPMADVHLRRAVAAALDRDELIKAGGGDRSPRADALTYAPDQRGYRPTMPDTAPGASRSRDTVAAQLAAAGYGRESREPAGGGTARPAGAGGPPPLTVAAVDGTEPYQSIARAAVEQLRRAGIQAELRTPSADRLYGSLLNTTATAEQQPRNRVDVLVTPRSVGGDPAAALASAYGCGGARQPGTGTRYPDNPGSVCVPALQPAIDAALSGARPLADVLPVVERDIWSRAVAIPLFQVTDLLAVRGDIRGVTTNPPQVAPFPSVAAWTRIRS